MTFINDAQARVTLIVGKGLFQVWLETCMFGFCYQPRKACGNIVFWQGMDFYMVEAIHVFTHCFFFHVQIVVAYMWMC